MVKRGKMKEKREKEGKILAVGKPTDSVQYTSVLAYSPLYLVTLSGPLMVLITGLMRYHTIRLRTTG